MNVYLLKDPPLEFGNEFVCVDPKIGITLGGFFSTTNFGHRDKINYTVIGTEDLIDSAVAWISQFNNFIEGKRKAVKTKVSASVQDDGTIRESYLFDESPVESSDNTANNETIEVNKKLNPDFPGCESKKISCVLENIPEQNFRIGERKVEQLVTSENNTEELFKDLVKIILDAYLSIKFGLVKPDICFLIIPNKIKEKFSKIDKGKFKLDLRRKLKASFFNTNINIPVQIILESTISGNKESIQDLSMIAWNFVIAQYYKANGVPWVLTEIDVNTCFLGISFHKEFNPNHQTVKSSIAQAFNRNGRGLVFVGEQFEWNKEITGTVAPHLTYEYSKNLAKKVISNYCNANNHKPNRVVIHKTTQYWNKSSHPEYQEEEGFIDGIQEVLGEDVWIDLVVIRDSRIRLLRQNAKLYPVVRGTFATLETKKGILYTTGYVPHYETYPGFHIPHPILIELHKGDSSIKKIAEEIFALTKLNFNNCMAYDSLPITIRFSGKVGEILPYISHGTLPPEDYKFYM